MTKNLVVVESPAKARTIERYLGPDYKVLASYGHVRDLPENPGRNKLGVDVEHDFKPEYVVADDRRKQLDSITKAAKSADAVYLATDLDREGEAIAWHVAEAAAVPEGKRRRVTFSEITRDAITDAFQHPRAIDDNLVDAQQTRRIIDRLVGYTLSPLLWRKVRAGLSAGRVQSVAVRLVVEREREITRLHGARVLDHRTAAGQPKGRDFQRRADDDRRQEGGDRRRRDRRTPHRCPPRHQARCRLSRDAFVQAQSGAAVHDLDPAAGGEPQARLQSGAHDARRPAPVRGRGHRRRAASA